MAMFSEDRRRTKNFDLEIVENEQKVIEIDLSGGQTLTGVMNGLATTEHGTVAVLRGEHEFDELRLETMSEIQPLAAGSGIVAADGSYSVEGLDPGLYTLRCRREYGRF
jgi:energy-coupling factor transporter ATP-binding protein EcfA2